MAAQQGQLIIICGLPGSGKTSRAISLAEQVCGVRFEPDEWMDALGLNLWDQDGRRAVEDLQWQVAKQVLTSRGTAILEWGTWAKTERDSLRRQARELGARVALIYLSAPPEELYRRISARGREVPPITLKQIEDWAKVFEEPDGDEQALYDFAGAGDEL